MLSLGVIISSSTIYEEAEIQSSCQPTDVRCRSVGGLGRIFILRSCKKIVHLLWYLFCSESLIGYSPPCCDNSESFWISARLKDAMRSCQSTAISTDADESISERLFMSSWFQKMKLTFLSEQEIWKYRSYIIWKAVMPKLKVLPGLSKKSRTWHFCLMTALATVDTHAPWHELLVFFLQSFNLIAPLAGMCE